MTLLASGISRPPREVALTSMRSLAHSTNAAVLASQLQAQLREVGAAPNQIFEQQLLIEHELSKQLIPFPKSRADPFASMS